MKYINTGLKYRFLDRRGVSVWWTSAFKAAANKHNSSTGEPSKTQETNLAKVPRAGGRGGWGGPCRRRSGEHREPPDSQTALNTHQRFERFSSESQPMGLMIKLKVFHSNSPSSWTHIVPNTDHLIGLCPLLSTLVFGWQSWSHHSCHFCRLLRDITLMRTANSLLDDKCVLQPWAFHGGFFLCCYFVCVMTGGGGCMERGVFVWSIFGHTKIRLCASTWAPLTSHHTVLAGFGRGRSFTGELTRRQTWHL